MQSHNSLTALAACLCFELSFALHLLMLHTTSTPIQFVPDMGYLAVLIACHCIIFAGYSFLA